MTGEAFEFGAIVKKMLLETNPVDFEFGETLDTIVDVSAETSQNNMKEQITVDFEDELKRAANAFGESLKRKDNNYTDFGLGASTTDYTLFGDCLII